MRDIEVRPDDGGRALRFTNEIMNRGAGVLQVDPQEDGVAADDCDGDGNGKNDQLACQRLYRDGDDGDGVFDRQVDQEYASPLAGCMAFHPAHGHWHFNDFARYLLKRNSTGERSRGAPR